MFIDTRTCDLGRELACDVCIAGGGTAGIALALNFLHRHYSVVVLESGGLDADTQSLDLYRGEVAGLDYCPLDQKRARYFGGTSNAWGGTCARLTRIDLEERPWVSHSGWPISLENLSRHYATVNDILGLSGYDDNPGTCEVHSGDKLPIEPTMLEHRLFGYSTPATNLRTKYRRDFERSTSVRVLLHANVVEIVASAKATQVEALRVAMPSGRHLFLRARHFILAMGGLETPRLLLNSTRAMAPGLGNQHDLVGRFFMDHIYVAAGRVAILPQRWRKAYRARTMGSGLTTQYGFRLSDSAQQRERALAACARLDSSIPLRAKSKSYRALWRFHRAAVERQLPKHPWLEIGKLLRDFGSLPGALWERFDPATYVIVQSEQAPNPDSRVMLSDHQDRLGLRRLRLEWQLSDADKHTVRVTVALLKREFARLGIGHVLAADWLESNNVTWTHKQAGGSHHMGTTRMADNPRRGVVDAHCRIHGIDNLFVAGPGVFPTGGYANPTYTVVAMSHRLAEHLHKRLQYELVAQDSKLKWPDLNDAKLNGFNKVTATV